MECRRKETRFIRLEKTLLQIEEMFNQSNISFLPNCQMFPELKKSSAADTLELKIALCNKEDETNEYRIKKKTCF